jgi:hypothetical protein
MSIARWLAVVFPIQVKEPVVMSRVKEIAVDHSGCDFKRRFRHFTSGFLGISTGGSKGRSFLSSFQQEGDLRRHRSNAVPY